MFTEQSLKKIILPLVVEQFLVIAMGLFDTIMVSSCGEAAISGISVVDAINKLLICLFAAIATGGGVVVSQYMGSGNREGIAKASRQLFWAVGVVSVLLALIALIFSKSLLTLLYGTLEADVMEHAVTYFYITALSYPFLGIYNSASALFRSVGNSKTPMLISLLANVLNVAGNALLILGLDMGVAGAGIATLFSHIVSAVVIRAAISRRDDVPVEKSFRIEPAIMKNILYIGIPGGIENSLFQLGNLLLGSLIAGFGTSAIAARAVVGGVGSFQLVPVNAISLAIITVVGQCVGAKDPGQAKKYLFKLIKIIYRYTAIIGVVLFVFGKPLCSLYLLSDSTLELALFILRFNCICVALFLPMSQGLPNGLRAANDVKFTMYVSIGSMWIFRILLAWFLGSCLGLELLGVWIAMVMDWAVKIVFFLLRVLSGRWEKYMKLTVASSSAMRPEP